MGSSDQSGGSSSPCGAIPYPGGSLSKLAAPDCATAAMKAAWSDK